MTPITDIDEQTRNEENTKLNYITPEIQKKWSAEGDQIIMEYGKTNNVYFTDGQIIVGSDGTVTRGGFFSLRAQKSRLSFTLQI